MVIPLTALALLGGTAVASHAATLTKARAVSAATAKAEQLAKGTAADAPGRATKVRCVRQNTKRYRCTTTIRGTPRCDDSAAGCAEAAPFEIPYATTVRLVGSRLRVTVAQA